MKSVIITVFIFFVQIITWAQDDSIPDVEWGNASYYNLNLGESISYFSTEIKLLELENHFSKIKVGEDTLWLKVAQRSLPLGVGGIRIFVADNKNLKSITEDEDVHGLLKKDALICVSRLGQSMLEPNQYFFPISFNDGFLWNAEEDSYMFSYLGMNKGGKYRSFEGIGIDMNDARGIEKHWIVALENSTVVWIEDKNLDEMGKQACVLLKSDLDPGIYYVYNGLYNKTLEVKNGQKLMRGELIGTAWGDEDWGYLQLAVVQSDTIPSYENRFHNVLNFFPQLYELYHKHSYGLAKSFSRGRLEFGKAAHFNRNKKNLLAFEEYSGKGWQLGRWNKADKVEYINSETEGNVRLKKVLFQGSKARSQNPNNYFDYEVNVKNGVYRIRAKVGDLFLPSWQKIEFEGVGTSIYSLKAGEQKWTAERVVKVSDRKLTIRIHIDKENKKVAGLSELVFQRAY